MTVDLIERLTAAMAETERITREAADGDSGEWFVGPKWNVYRAEDENPHGEEEHRLVVQGNVEPQSAHIALNDPKRILDGVAADREMLEEIKRNLADDNADETMLWFLRTLAKRYSLDLSGSAVIAAIIEQEGLPY